MERKITTTLMLIVCSLMATAQPSIEWQYSLGGTLSDLVDQGNRVSNTMKQTPDGGYIIAATSYSNDGDVTGHNGPPSAADNWIVKLDSLGGIEWQHSIGGTADDFARGVDITSDGGYIVIGDSFSDDGDVSNHFGSTDTSDAWVVKLDSNGNIQWDRSYGGSNFDVGSHIEEISGGYIFIGDSRSADGDVSINKGIIDLWVVKIDTVGNIIWEKSLGGSGSERPDVIRTTSDGGYILSAFTSSNDGDVSNNIHPPPFWDIWIVKLNSIGNIQWEKTFGGSLIDYGSDVVETTDGGFILTGYTNSTDDDMTCNKGMRDNWVAKLDASGNIEWSKCYGGSDNERGKSIRQTPDGGYLLGSSTESDNMDVSFNNGEEDCWIVKIDSLGVIEWEQSYGGSDFETISNAILTSDGGIAFVGQSLSNDGDVSGHHGSLSEQDVWMVKLSTLTGLSELSSNISFFNVAPNPAVRETRFNFHLNSASNVLIEILDMQGRQIHALLNTRLPSGQHYVDWKIDNDLTTGIYIVRLIGEGIPVTKKVLVKNQYNH